MIAALAKEAAIYRWTSRWVSKGSLCVKVDEMERYDGVGKGNEVREVARGIIETYDWRAWIG